MARAKKVSIPKNRPESDSEPLKDAAALSAWRIAELAHQRGVRLESGASDASTSA